MESPASYCDAHQMRRVCQPGFIMSSINGLGQNSPVQKIVSNPIQKQIPAAAPEKSSATDKLELSGVSHLLKTLKTNDIRADKVADLRAQIEAGTYETDERLNGSLDGLLDDLLKE